MAREFGRRIGLSGNYPLFVTHDPCASTGKIPAKRIGMKDGYPYFAVGECNTANPQPGKKYLAKREGIQGDYPQFLLACRNCIPPSCLITVRVRGCTLAKPTVPGIPVTIAKGGDSWSGVTGPTGDAVIDTGGVPGPYTITATGSGRWGTATTTNVSPACGVGVTTLVLPAADGYICTECCPYPLKTTLYVSSRLGTVPLIWKPAMNCWFACQDTGNSCYVPGTEPASCSGTAKIAWRFALNRGCGIQLGRVFSSAICDYGSEPCTPLACFSCEDVEAGTAVLSWTEPFYIWNCCTDFGAITTGCDPFFWQIDKTLGSPLVHCVGDTVLVTE